MTLKSIDYRFEIKFIDSPFSIHYVLLLHICHNATFVKICKFGRKLAFHLNNDLITIMHAFPYTSGRDLKYSVHIPHILVCQKLRTHVGVIFANMHEVMQCLVIVTSIKKSHPSALTLVLFNRKLILSF